MLMLLGVSSGALMIMTAAITASWSLTLILVVAGLSGLAVGSWNGVYLAEVASHAAKGKVSEATAGSTFLTFLGYVFGPVLFSIAVQTTGIYAPAFIAAGVLPIIAGLTLVRVRWSRR
jgi:MFS family permease